MPTLRLARNLLRVTPAVPAVALWWMLTLGLAKTTGHHAAAAHLPVVALTLEAATLLAASLALAAIAQRRTADGNTDLIAAPAVLLLAAAWLLPHPAALILTPIDPHWTASHYRWTAVLATALVAFLWASHERERRRVRPRAGPAQRGEACEAGAAPTPGRPKVDRTLAQRRAAQRKRLGAAESDYAAAETDRDRAEQLLDAHQHRIADLQADLDRLTDQLELTRQALGDARKQLPRLQRGFNQAARNAAAVRKRRDTEQRRMNALEH